MNIFYFLAAAASASSLHLASTLTLDLHMIGYDRMGVELQLNQTQRGELERCQELVAINTISFIIDLYWHKLFSLA